MPIKRALIWANFFEPDIYIYKTAAFGGGYQSSCNTIVESRTILQNSSQGQAMKIFVKILIFVLSLFLNVAMLASETVFAMASSAFRALTDMPTAAKEYYESRRINGTAVGSKI